MSSKTNTFFSREETQGRRYPLFVERLLWLSVVIGCVLLHPKVLEMIDGVFGMLAAWCGLPLVLLLCAEMIGRVVQTMHKGR